MKKPEAAIRKKAPAKKKKPGQTIKNNAKNKLRVLILEDNPADAELMERQLRRGRIPCQMQRVETRAAFRKALINFKPDIILADYSLPKFNAMQALAIARKKFPNLPLIIVTGSIGEEKAVACLRAGANDYLLKDRLARLPEAVRHALALRRLQSENRKQEKRLQTSERTHRIFIDASTDMAFLKDDQFRHLLANREFCRFFNKKEKAIIGKTDFQFMDKAAAAKCRQSDRQTLATMGIHVSEETANGRTFETRKFPVELAEGRIGIGGYIRDISESKLHLKLIEQSSKKWFTTFDSIQDGIALLAVDQTIIQANQAFADLVQKPIKEIIGKKCYELVHPDQQPDPHCSFAKSAKSKKREFTELKINERVMKIVTDPLKQKSEAFSGAVHIMTDITEHKQSEEKLRLASKRLELALNAAKAGAWDWAMETGCIEWTPQMFDLFGLDRRTSSATFAAWRRALHPDDRESAEKRIDQALKGHTTLDSDYRVVWPDGRVHWINAVGVGVYDASGRPNHMIGICQDISERKQNEEQIRASLREKEILLKEIHHRVKNNLQVISGLLTLQSAQIDDERLLRMIQDSQSRIWAMSLIHQTLYQSGNLASVNLADYIRDLVATLLSGHAQRATAPHISFDLLPLRLGIDKSIPLALILNELVINAIKHAFIDGRNGEIRISLQECRGAKSPPPADGENAHSYELTVADNGVGLPAGFDLKNQKSLGLQLVTMLTKQLGGTLAMTSGQGTAVTIAFDHHEKTEKQP